MDRCNYREECMSLLSSNQFVHIANDPTKSLESKIKHTLRKIKSKLSDQEFKNLYPTGSCPGNFYGTVKIHKLSVNGGINDIPIRQTVSNLNIETLSKTSFKVIITFTAIKKYCKEH